MFCPKCGSAVTSENPVFCPSCGNELSGVPGSAKSAATKIPYQFQPPFGGTGYSRADLIPSIANKIRNNATIWAILGSLQIVIGLLTLFFLGIFAQKEYYSSYGDYWTTRTEANVVMIVTGSLMIVIGIINIYISTKNRNLADKILAQPCGVYETFLPVQNLVGTFIYNLLFGGFIGVIGSIYAFMLRNYVLSNAVQIKYIEALYYQDK